MGDRDGTAPSASGRSAVGSVAPRSRIAAQVRFPRVRFGGRVVVGLALLYVAVRAVEEIDRLRFLEAEIGSHVVERVMGQSYHPAGTALVYYPGGGPKGTFRALEITWQCSVVWAVVPILAVAAGLVLVPRVSWWRLVLAVAVGVAVVALVNQLRILIIALSTSWWGRDGYELSHRLVGSGLVLLSVAMGVSLVWRSSPGSRRRGARAR